MTKYEVIDSADLHNGVVGYVEFKNLVHHPGKCGSQVIMILCEVIGIREKRVEVVPVTGDKTCLWIDSNRIYSKSRL